VIFLCVGLLVAVVAAARSTYSPCGLSMLSSITPFGERARQHRYRVTAGWFVAGAVAGGATLGAVSAGLAVVTGQLGPAGPWRMGVGAALAAAAALIDAGAFGPILPLIRRQVDDRWLARYRPWVYAGGFGWQVGVGFATYLMTAGGGLVVCLGGLSGSPLVALCLGVLFGLARGGTVFLTAGASSPVQLRALHRRLDAVGPAVHRSVVGLQGGVALGLAASAWLIGTAGPTGLGALVAVLAAVMGALAGVGLASRRAGAHAGTSVVP
jgi:hypothetical protein